MRQMFLHKVWSHCLTVEMKGLGGSEGGFTDTVTRDAFRS